MDEEESWARSWSQTNERTNERMAMRPPARLLASDRDTCTAYIVARRSLEATAGRRREKTREEIISLSSISGCSAGEEST